MRVTISPRVYRWLGKPRSLGFSWEIEAEEYRRLLDEVRLQHPDLALDEAEDRALYRNICRHFPAPVPAGNVTVPLSARRLILVVCSVILLFILITLFAHRLLGQTPVLPVKATAAAPTYAEGSTVPASVDLSGQLRIAGGGGGGPADVAANAAASETDTARQKVTAAIRVIDTSLAAGSQLVTAKGDQTNGLWVNCKLGCGSSSFSDNSAFTAGTTAVSITAGVFNDGLAALLSGNAAAPRITSFRGVHFNLRDNSGNEILSAIAAPAGTERGLITRNIPSGTQTVSGSGTFTTDPIDRTARVLGRAFLRNPGDTANMGDATTPVRTDPTGTTTQPISAISLPLPAGASTSAKQPALGTAGAASADVITVQGIAGMTKLLVTPDSVALPANQSVNVAQIAGTNTVTGGVAGLMAVGGNVANAVAATSNPVPVGGIFTTTPTILLTGQTATLQFTAAQNAKHDITTIAGTAPTTVGKIDVKGADGDVFVRQATASNLNAAIVGTGTAGAPAGNILTVQGVASMTKLLVTPDSVALPANQSVNVSQINGVTPLMGNGITGTGSQRVTIASDNTAFAVNATLSAETTKVIGTVNPSNTANTTPWLVTPTPGTTGGWSKVKYTAQGTTVQTVKSSAGTFGGYYVSNPNTASSCVQVFDNSAAITLGTTAPDMVFEIPGVASAGGTGAAANLEISLGVNMANAIKLAATTTCTGSTAPTNGLNMTIFYK